MDEGTEGLGGDARGEVTRLLSSLGHEDPARITDALLPLVYDELRRLARQVLQGEAPGRTLQPTALVHEAYLRLADQRDTAWRNRRHFLGVAAQAMRRIVIDAARARRADRRGGGWQRVTLAAEPGTTEQDVDLLAVDEALTELNRLGPRQARLVELRFFAGLAVEEAAEVLDVSRSTAEADWRVARAWLASRLESPPA